MAYTIVLLGNTGAGKTCLLDALMKRRFNPDCPPTGHVSLAVQLGLPFQTSVYDAPGQTGAAAQFSRQTAMQQARTAIYCVDLGQPIDDQTSAQIFGEIQGFLSGERRMANVVLVGTKSDSVDEEVVRAKMVKLDEIARRNPISIGRPIVLSAKNGWANEGIQVLLARLNNKGEMDSRELMSWVQSVPNEIDDVAVMPGSAVAPTMTDTTTLESGVVAVSVDEEELAFDSTDGPSSVTGSPGRQSEFVVHPANLPASRSPIGNTLDQSHLQVPIVSPGFPVNTGEATLDSRGGSRSPLPGEDGSTGIPLSMTVRPSLWEESKAAFLQEITALNIDDSTNMKIRLALTQLEKDIQNPQKTDKSKPIDNFVTRCGHILNGHPAKKAMNFVLKLAAVAVITVIAGLIGFGIGFAAGAWSGPGAFFTGLAGGSAAAVAVVAAAGVVGGVSAIGLFKSKAKPMQSNKAADTLKETLGEEPTQDTLNKPRGPV